MEPAAPAPAAAAGPPPSAAAAGPPLLEARAARVAVDDVVAIDALTVETRGDRVLCAGDTGALFAALTGIPLSAARRPAPPASADDILDEAPGEARVVAGRLAVAGRDVGGFAQRAASGAAPLDPPLPLAWTAEAYVAWSARLAGASARAAAELAPAALARVGLAAARRRTLQTLALPERRALVLAQAIAAAPPVVIAEDPLVGLDDGAAGFVLAALAGATEGRGALITAARLDAEGPQSVLLRGATSVVVLAGGELAFAGTFAEIAAGGHAYALTVRTNVGPLREELAARGITLRGGPARFTAALPEGTTARDIVLAAARCRAAIVELVPLF
ncbi:ABC transporter ATP-binding protein [Sorangium cellulosum]|uniref:ABC transporter ATP-binding protein n=1 Tax=Sorangium cellulosum TaxID=56 RepID=A0A2L0F986_SORCE|nr:ABC transporter ATP-binding protein [Sorangium cellulosum]AUX48103.1 ABC transporter ATP-binding protein [Sorangium cellulosum]